MKHARLTCHTGRSRRLACAILLAAVAMTAINQTPAGATCPFCTADTGQFCKIETSSRSTPAPYGSILINITYGKGSIFRPMGGIKVHVQYYDANRTLGEAWLAAGEDGIATFVPTVPGYHAINACGHSVLLYVNGVCGDGICSRKDESRIDCPEDCAFCGDTICDSNENMSCGDCQVCGDRVCSATETAAECPYDCAARATWLQNQLRGSLIFNAPVMNLLFMFLPIKPITIKLKDSYQNTG